MFIKFFISFFIIISSVFQISFAEEKKFTKVKSYLKNLNSFEADFIQISSDGSIKKGKIHISIPGKLRISYEQPNNILITSKGFWLVVQDRNLKQTNNYPINKTPLNLFLNEKINFKNNQFKIHFEKVNGIISVEFLDDNQLIGSSFKLIFSENPIQLKKWIINDEFDNKTSVLFQNMILGKKYSHILFFPEDFGDNINN